MADKVGFKAARKYIAMIKREAPRMALKIVDEAIQMHGAHGVSQDSRLGDMYTGQLLSSSVGALGFYRQLLLCCCSRFFVLVSCAWCLV